MISPAPSSIAAPKPAPQTAPQTAARTTATAQPGLSGTSTGEVSAANVKAESIFAVDAAEQSAAAARLREEETAERTARNSHDKDKPTGPPPAFEESPLERQARAALDPPEFQTAVTFTDASDTDQDRGATIGADAALDEPHAEIKVPPTPSDRAKAGFAETRALNEPHPPVQLNQKG